MALGSCCILPASGPWEVHFLADSEISDTDREAANLLAATRDVVGDAVGEAGAGSVHVWTTVLEMSSAIASGLSGVNQIVIPEMETGSLSEVLSESEKSQLSQLIQAGRHLIVHGCDGHPESQRAAGLLNDLAPWGMSTGSWTHAGSFTRLLGGGGFQNGPPTLPGLNAICPTDSAPATADGLYDGPDGKTVAWTAPHGAGRITYMAYDYFAGTGDDNWHALLQSSLTFWADALHEAPHSARRGEGIDKGRLGLCFLHWRSRFSDSATRSTSTRFAHRLRLLWHTICASVETPVGEVITFLN